MLTRAMFLGGIAMCVMWGQSAFAADWWPADLSVKKDGKEVAVKYSPLSHAAKKWQLCLLLPHLKDTYWVAINFGAVEEARRQGVAMVTLDAGGYDQLPKQISQFDDCLASKADAIIVAVISETGLAAKMKEAIAKGVPVIALGNPVKDTPVTAKITPNTYDKAFAAGQFLVKALGDKGGKVVSFPGPQGSGWAESYAQGFKDSLKGTKVTLLAETFGNPTVSEQLPLVEDALQTYPDLSAIWGGAPTAEAAIGAVADSGRKNIAIMSTWENQAMLADVENGSVMGFGTEFPPVYARVGVDLAIRALEGKLEQSVFEITPALVTRENIHSIDASTIFAPQSYQPVFDVK